MTLLYNRRVFLDHDTGQHPERAERVTGTIKRLEDSGLKEQCRCPEFERVARRRLARVHAPKYIDEVCAFARSGGGNLDPDTVVCAASFEVAVTAAGCVCDATERVVRGEDNQAFCLVRPPGHHALVDRAMGFCLFNNVAVGARTAVEELELDRVLIVDWDVHHGNGTQDAFWEDPAVGFLSIHRWPYYPGTGRGDETGGGRGEGTTLNLPIEIGTSRAEYLKKFTDSLEAFAEKIKPQLVFVSAGFDAHGRDPIGNLGLETEDYATLLGAVLDVAEAYASGRIICVLEGGYHPQAMADCIELQVEELLRRERRCE